MPSAPLTLDLPRDEFTPETFGRILNRQWTLIMQILNATLKTDLAANRPPVPVFDETMFYASDTGVTSIGVLGAWLTLAGLTGTVTSTTTTPYTIAATDATVLIDATAGNKVVAVPQGARYKGRIWSVKKVDSTGNTVTITPASGNIDGAATKVLSAQYKSVIFTSDGTNSWILGQV
jgi:hypothetical protein